MLVHCRKIKIIVCNIHLPIVSRGCVAWVGGTSTFELKVWKEWILRVEICITRKPKFLLLPLTAPLKHLAWWSVKISTMLYLQFYVSLILFYRLTYYLAFRNYFSIFQVDRWQTWKLQHRQGPPYKTEQKCTKETFIPEEGSGREKAI